MTAAELIAALSEVPPDTQVVVDGYEGDYDDPHVHGVLVGQDRGPSGYVGKYPHRYAKDYLEEGYVDASPVLVLSRAPFEEYEPPYEYPSFDAAKAALVAS